MFNQPTVLDPAPYAAALRQVARRAHRLMSRMGEGTAEHDLREVQVVLHQIAYLRQHVQSPRSTDLQRWLTRVEEQMKELQERMLRKARPTGRPGPVQALVDWTY